MLSHMTVWLVVFLCVPVFVFCFVYEHDLKKQQPYLSVYLYISFPVPLIVSLNSTVFLLKF